MPQITIPPLANGEIYIGLIGDAKGAAYHLILLAGDNDRAPHAQQIEWAKSIGGDLPNKLEAAMLFSHAKDQFQPTWYWTNENFVDPNDSEDADFAWVQNFYDGYQISDHEGYDGRARAVRRLPI